MQVFTSVFPDPARHLDRTDIIALSVVGTALGNQNGIAIFQILNRLRTGDLHCQISLSCAISIENEVKGMSFGTIFATVPNA